MDRFKKARDLGCSYLLDRQHSDGSFGDPEMGLADYYKVPSAFLVCGQSSAASHLCDWIRKNGMTSEGDFTPRPEEARGYPYTYYNTWVVIGAHRLGQYDLSQKGMDFLMRFRDSESGGFYSSGTERSEDTKQDLWVVSGCGQAALVTGRTDVARGVGRWMRILMEAQPKYPEQLFSVYSRAVGLHTSPDPDDEIRYVMHKDATRDQYFFHPGIAGGFLARLYQATGEREWLELAKEYVRFAEGAGDYLFRILRAGKVAWASSVLFTLTGDEKYREMAVRIGDNVIDAQQPDGSWISTNTGEVSNDATAEMVVWLDEIHQAVGED